MNIKIDISELLYALDNTPADQNIMLAGRHGIGKSEILTEYFTNKGIKVIALFLGQMSDPGDLIGLPDKSGEKTIFRPPYWFPLDGQPIVLFLDELNRARPEVLQTIMDLALNRRLAGRDLPKGSRIIAAVNEGEEYQLTDLDPALVSRFNIFRFEPSVDEWIVWAKKKKLDERVIQFISQNKDWLDRDPQSKISEDTGLDKSPDRRGWKRVSDILTTMDYIDKNGQKLIASIIGIRATQKFMSEVRNGKKLSAEDFLKDYDTYINEVVKLPLHEWAILNEGIFQFLEVGNVPEVNKIAKNLEKYIVYLRDNKKGEVLSTISSNVTSGHYNNATTFITSHCPSILPILMSHISSYRR